MKKKLTNNPFWKETPAKRHPETELEVSEHHVESEQKDELATPPLSPLPATPENESHSFDSNNQEKASSDSDNSDFSTYSYTVDYIPPELKIKNILTLFKGKEGDMLDYQLKRTESFKNDTPHSSSTVLEVYQLAQDLLEIYYHRKINNPEAVKIIIEYYDWAANKHHAASCYELVGMYCDGELVPSDYEKAAYYVQLGLKGKDKTEYDIANYDYKQRDWISRLESAVKRVEKKQQKQMEQKQTTAPSNK
jgi:hypothetical protein